MDIRAYPHLGSWEKCSDRPVQTHLWCLQSPLGTCAGVESVNQTVALFSLSWGTPILVPVMAAPVTLPPAGIKIPLFSHPSNSSCVFPLFCLCCCCVLDDSQSDWGETESVRETLIAVFLLQKSMLSLWNKTSPPTSKLVFYVYLGVSTMQRKARMKRQLS